MRRLAAAFLREGERRRSRHYLLGLDFDGTLAPIMPKPGLAKLPPENKRLLQRLLRLRRARVAVVSGRSLVDIKRKIQLPGLIYVGNHGLEIEDVDGKVWVHPQAQRQEKLMGRLARRIAAELKDFPGVFVEDKRLTLSVHYRRLPRYLSPAPIHERLNMILDGLGHRVRLRLGKKVWEIRPALDWNKGYAVRRLLGAKVDRWTPCLVGDDATDEEGFKSLGPEAITVRVGYKKDSHARFRVKSQKQVRLLLEYFAREWRGESARGELAGERRRRQPPRVERRLRTRRRADREREGRRSRLTSGDRRR